MTLFARSLSRLAPLPPRERVTDSSQALLDADLAIRLTDDTYASYETIYATQPWVMAAVDKLARGVGRIPLKAYTVGADGQRALARDGALVELLREPVPGVSPFAWKSALVGNVLVYGSCIALKVQPDGPRALPQAIWPFSPRGWRIDARGDYLYHPADGSPPLLFPSWRVWHVAFWAPGSFGARGVSPFEALRRTLAIEDAAQRLGVASFRNGARPSGVLSYKERLRDDAVRRLRANVRRLHGGPDRAFNIAVLQGDYQWTPLSHNLSESAVVPHRLLTREEVAAAFDIPQPAIGILDKANFASISALHLMLYQDTYGVWTEMLEEDFRVDVLGPTELRDSATVKFDLRGLLRGDAITRSTTNQRAISTGWATQNEVREWEDLPRLDDPAADRLLRPANLMPDPAEQSGAQNAPGTNTSEV